MTSRMAWTTDCSRIVIHHLAKRLHAGSQAKQLEARRNVRHRLELQRSRRDGSRCSKLVHGVAFLCGITTPSLAAQGGQRRFSYFNIGRDNSRPTGQVIIMGLTNHFLERNLSSGLCALPHGHTGIVKLPNNTTK
jgi:hypothetical protein